jgi:hypothetical protein
MSQNVWATIMPFGPVTNFILAQKNIFGPAKGCSSFQALLIPVFDIIFFIYSQTYIKRSLMGQRKSGLIGQVTS